MLAGISAVWGLPITTAFLATLIGGAITGSAGTILGRAAVGGLCKLIPGAGAVVGGTINASTASLLTTAFGEAYITTLYYLMKDNPARLPTPQEIIAAFKAQLKMSRKHT
jgi:uncharacterized protein (DUF697 family)